MDAPVAEMSEQSRSHTELKTLGDPESTLAVIRLVYYYRPRLAELEPQISPPETNMSTGPFREPYQISLRFYRALLAKAIHLEIDAFRDESIATGIDDPDQLRRQRLLIQAQRDEAERLRDFLSFTMLRPASL